MIRLSEKLRDIINEQDFCFNSTEIKVVERAIRKFKLYEDTGLTPDEVEAQKCYRIDGMPLMRFVEIITAERDGRLIVLPCKEGMRLWLVWDGEIHDQHVVSVSFQDHIKPRFLVECVPFLRFYWDELIGKRVFLTREEAEAALMEGEIK